jgi:hypothetical protein
MVGAGGSAVALGLLYGVLGNAIPKTRSDLLEFEKKLARDLPEYRFGVTGALAAAGAVGLASETRRERSNQVLRAGFLILIAWGVVVLLGYVAGGVLHLRIPAHRFLSFALTVPLLGAVGLLWIARGVSTLWRPLGAIVVVAGLAVAGVAVHDQWFENKPWIEDGKIQQADTVAAYLQGAHVPVTRPVVFVIGTKDPNGAGLMGHEIRAAIPADRIRHTYVFVGSAEDFLARRAEPDPVSALYLRRMGSVFDQRPVAVITSSYNDTFFGQWARAHPGSKIDPDVAVVQGPPVPAKVPARAAGASTAVVPSVWSFGLTAVGALLVLGLSGLGWALAVPRRWAGPFEVIALAPAFGVAALTLGGVVADRLGFRPGGLSGALVPAAVAVAGVGVAVWLGRRRRAPVADGPPAA